VSTLRTDLCGISLEHPLANGSGTLDALAAGTLGLAAFVTKTVTLNPRAGNPPPRIAETPAGMVNSIRLGLPDQSNYVVTNCDFNQYMWTSAAAGCLATQLYNFITTKHIDDLVVITHSNGGNVMRWIMSNPTYDSRYPTIIKSIRWVDAIAASSAGTPLANAVIAGNVFDTSVGWLLGYQNDAVRQQQTSWMAYYNANYLLDILRTIDSDEVEIRLNTPVTAGLVVPAPKDEAKGASPQEDLLCLVMPLRLAG